MADVYFNCVCGKSLAVDERGVGLVVLCVDCGAPVTVPDYALEFNCARCRTTLLAPDTGRGKWIKCTVCGHPQTAPGMEAPLVARPDPMPRHWPVKLMFRLAALALALAGGAVITAWFIPARRARVYYQKKPPPEVQGAGSIEADFKPAGARPGLPSLSSTAPAETLPAEVSGPQAADQASARRAGIAAAPSAIAPKARQPGQGELMRKFMELDALRSKQPGQYQPGVYLEGLKRFRALVDACGREYTGKELDDAAWDVVFRSTYEFIGQYDCENYADSERLVREGFDLLTELDPPHWRRHYTLLMDLVAGHVQRWQDREPLLSAQMLDAASAMVLGLNDGELTNYWYWRMDVPLIGFLWHSQEIDQDRRDAFYRAREQALLAGLTNDLVPLERRGDLLSDWARYLVRNGQPDKAARMVNSWLQRHGAASDNADFCRIWMETALFANGDWEEADQVLRAATQGAAKWTKPSDLSQYEMICRMYYENWLWPGFELQRRRAATAGVGRERKTT